MPYRTPAREVDPVDASVARFAARIRRARRARIGGVVATLSLCSIAPLLWAILVMKPLPPRTLPALYGRIPIAISPIRIPWAVYPPPRVVPCGSVFAAVDDCEEDVPQEAVEF